MTTLKRKVLSQSSVCERVKKRLQRPEGEERDGERDIVESEDEEQIFSQYFGSKADHEARLSFDFFNQPCVDLAKAFLGKVSLIITPWLSG